MSDLIVEVAKRNNLIGELKLGKEELEEKLEDQLKEIILLCSKVTVRDEEINALHKDNQKLKDKAERYEKALKFYADKENYAVTENNLDPTTDYVHIVDMDEGDTARKALNSGRLLAE